MRSSRARTLRRAVVVRIVQSAYGLDVPLRTEDVNTFANTIVRRARELLATATRGASLTAVEPPNPAVLPRGRHRLTREQVAASQRTRLMVGMAEVVSEKGYARTSVADVLKRVRVSRETFYEHFADKQACFLAAFDKGSEALLASVDEALGSADLPPLERLDRALTAYLDRLAAEPALARTFLLEVYAAGQAATDRRFRIQREFSDVLNGVLLEDRRWRAQRDPRFACRLLVAGIGALVTAQVAAGNHASLPALRDPVLALVHELLGEVNE